MVQWLRIRKQHLLKVADQVAVQSDHRPFAAANGKVFEKFAKGSIADIDMVA